MSNYTLRPAQRGNAKPLVGLYGESGAGKTWSALLLARGFVGPAGKIAMIETEAGRGEVYAGVAPVGDYLVRSLGEPFSPERYGEAISDCEKAKVDALIIDSGSHEWEAVGCVLDMAAANEEKGWKGQIVWTRPKLSHSRHFVLRFAQTPIPLVILCLRSKFPLEEVVNDKGKKDLKRTTIPVPIQSDTFINEMLIHGWIDREHRIHVTKYPLAIPELRGVVPDLQPITTETGARLAVWASGTTTESAGRPSSQASAPSPDEGAPADLYLSPDDQLAISDECRKLGTGALEALLKRAGVASIALMPADKLDSCRMWIETKRQA